MYVCVCECVWVCLCVFVSGSLSYVLTLHIPPLSPPHPRHPIRRTCFSSISRLLSRCFSFTPAPPPFLLLSLAVTLSLSPLLSCVCARMRVLCFPSRSL